MREKSESAPIPRAEAYLLVVLIVVLVVGGYGFTQAQLRADIYENQYNALLQQHYQEVADYRIELAISILDKIK